MDSVFKKLLDSDEPKDDGIDLCPLCDQPSRNRCTGCYVIRYCSKECQLAHWKKHKKICKETKNQYIPITLIKSNEKTSIPKDNFIVEIQISPGNDGSETENLTLSEKSSGVLGTIDKNDASFASILEKIQAEGVDKVKGFFHAVVDKEQKVRVNVQKILTDDNRSV